jgi:hypothetical protein
VCLFDKPLGLCRRQAHCLLDSTKFEAVELEEVCELIAVIAKKSFVQIHLTEPQAVCANLKKLAMIKSRKQKCLTHKNKKF